MIEAVLGWPEDRLLQALEAALHAKVIVAESEPEEIYRFSHGLMREVLYRQQLTRGRKHLHGHVAGALEELAARHRIAPDPASLAHHFMAAEEWEKAIHHCVRAGEAARDRHASHNALLFFRQALDAAGRLPTAEPGLLAMLQERLGQAHMVLNQQEHAEADFIHMLESARASGDSLAEGRALFWLSFIRTRLYQIGDALHCRRGIAGSGGGRRWTIAGAHSVEFGARVQDHRGAGPCRSPSEAGRTPGT